MLRPASRLRARLLSLLSLAVCAANCARTPPDPSLYIPGIWPTVDASRRISSPFGTRTDPITGRQQFHAGIDIAAARKSEVVATAHGRVVDRGRDRGGYGKYIEVDHGNGYVTRYAHLAYIKANIGKDVKRGDRLGRVGMTGRATGAHVHYEVRRDGKPIDPKPFLPGAP
jgi:murein DD-endopeptidase MepM/ murein hydrolase activator NlpD